MEPYLSVGRFLGVLYFLFLMILFPFANFVDKVIYDAYILP